MRHGARSFGHTLHVSLAVLLIGGGVMFEFSHSALWAARNKGVSRGRQQYWVVAGKVESREAVSVHVMEEAYMQVSAVNCPQYRVLQSLGGTELLSALVLAVYRTGLTQVRSECCAESGGSLYTYRFA